MKQEKQLSPVDKSGKGSSQEKISVLWCPVCRQNVRVSSAAGKGLDPNSYLTLLCSNCDLCMLKAVAARNVDARTKGST